MHLVLLLVVLFSHYVSCQLSIVRIFLTSGVIRNAGCLECLVC
uniref:Uncharacterized protein n=1 Tax=Pristhesancus plagipennis TaxID=1955184 RepID=A0A2K8JMS3_PRIPG|nr:secreted hypothetical protein [Pristhesancus plagipennis]